MLHEAVHALATRRGIKDTSAVGNRYHSKRFVALAAELGLRGPDVPGPVRKDRRCNHLGSEVRHFAEWWGHEDDLDFQFLETPEVAQAIEEKPGLSAEARLERTSYPGEEGHPPRVPTAAAARSAQPCPQPRPLNCAP